MQTKHIDSNELQLDDNQYLGIGTYGLVKRGVWRSRQVAVKYLRQERDKPSFLRELKQLCMCDHDNIVRIFGANKEDNFFVMEYADCGTLCRVLHSMHDVNYSIVHAIKWAVQMGSAVAYLHNQKPRPIVHRDLKPLNLLLFQAGRVLKVCDFGTARTADSYMSNLKGTCLWMAPEVCGPKEQSGPMSKYSEKCDVFSWGIILWEMLARKRPYAADFEMRDTIKIMLHVVLEQGRPRHLEGCPPELHDLITSCWTEAPEERPSMDDCVRLLSMLIPHLPDFDKPLDIPGAAACESSGLNTVASPSVTEEAPPATVSRHDTEEAHSDEDEEEANAVELEISEGDPKTNSNTLNRPRPDSQELSESWELLNRDELVPFQLDLAHRPELQAREPIPGNSVSQSLFDNHQEWLRRYAELQKEIAVEEQKKYDVDRKLRSSCSDEEEWLRMEEYMRMMREMDDINSRFVPPGVVNGRGPM